MRANSPAHLGQLFFHRVSELGERDWDRLEKLDRDNRLKDSNDGDAAGESEALKANLRDAAQQALGGRVKFITYGGAAMPPRILRFLLGVPLIGSMAPLNVAA